MATKSSTSQAVSKLRQPIVCVLGHVDHGKTTLLDLIRGTSVASKEPGGITQRIAATTVDISRILKETEKLNTKGLKIPGLLFIDTPGHVAFSNMRARGGALADLAILVIDINEGIMPQTVESIDILKKFKTPFIIAANKIDLIPFFTDVKTNLFTEFIRKQRQEYVNELDNRIYSIMNKLYEFGLNSDRFDRISDFTKTIAIVPVSAKKNIGVPEILMVLAGLAQRFLEREIEYRDINGHATIIEVRKEESAGITLDAVLYQGTISVGDSIAVNTKNGPAVTKVKALFVNTGKGQRALKEVKKVSAAEGIRVLISDKIDVISGSPMIVVRDNLDQVMKEIEEESKVDIPLSEEGIYVKAEAIGSLEAISYELNKQGIKIKQAQVGDITKRDIMDVSTLPDPINRIIVGFNVSVLPEARDAMSSSDVSIVTGDIIYKIVEDTQKVMDERKKMLLQGRKMSMPVPSRIRILPQYIFRASKPVIVGVRVETGQIKVGDNLIRGDGKYAGTIKSIRNEDVSVRYQDAPAEVAVAIDNVTLNRQIFPDDVLYVDITENVVKELRRAPMEKEIMDTLEEIIRIKRKDNPFWGTRV
ncbi:translation initiation factor IF-2 related protein [Thermoplasma acidophilum]|uniref:Probable translation initiation factor IF-2 n=1 Tax=Thermoplasma acidophilum (strain ATCC 25905 / DSM 1728 / JCM 9062 / NBRC 15155 / AMRC-C165) TaxID=273075 RepID=IF2P_THEAC|nr:translation initiation factor IF-2 [Thermoplasma acidophilum]Q9HJ60.1 RecName: Full=Probable translation initiation factor IF-2 [Thermoplasma acidophilum DSM 1728]MCY0851845.1 translation initiation factor IF-2 [Thermoplasma acidophilum]CAC12239.1 translation initiation factor IF-2 related protein [Thermoplasma acidophilum]